MPRPNRSPDDALFNSAILHAFLVASALWFITSVSIVAYSAIAYSVA
jgi:hypothetical protein